MSSRVAALLSALLVAGLLAPGVATAAGCADYASQAAAQQRLRSNPNDPEKLDDDNDGLACEQNPGPFDRALVPRPLPPGQTPAPRHPYLGPQPPPLGAYRGGEAPPPLAQLHGGKVSMIPPSQQRTAGITPPNTGEAGLVR